MLKSYDVKSEIENKTLKIMKENNFNVFDYEIVFGYDCFDIEIINKTKGIFSDMIETLKDEFDNDIIYIFLNDEGNITLRLDTNTILVDD